MKYDPSKHQEGTPASVKFAKSMTPGENKKKKDKKMSEGKDFFEFRKELEEGSYHVRQWKHQNQHTYPRKKGSKPLPLFPDKKQKNVKEDGMDGHSVKGGHKRTVKQGAGMTKKGVEKYRRENPGSKLSTAVTTPPSKLKPGSKAANRRKSFCARSRGWTGERGRAARRRWNC